MINPSANGWIDKFFLLQPPHLDDIPSTAMFYKQTRSSGFIFGHVVSLHTKSHLDTTGWTKNEITKVSLLYSLYNIFQISTNLVDPTEFINRANAFYDHINPQGFSLMRKVFVYSKSANLEDIIDERAQTNQDIVTKNFSHLLTNALLFVDALAFKRFLSPEGLPDKYLKKIEETIINIISLALKTKTVKSAHDKLLIKLFEASVRYSKFSDAQIHNLDAVKLDYFSEEMEKLYLIDLAAMTLWTDGILEKEEAYFLYKLAEQMHLRDADATESMIATTAFITKHKNQIPYLNHSSAAKNLYDNITQNVIILITRNKKRLRQEIQKSGELMVLLAHSTHRDLDSKEKKKVKNQLLEICKSIPSLTIFLLPGGSLLLPILIKFIPKMLPSTFNENHNPE